MFPTLLGDIDIWGQRLEPGDFAVILLLVVLEGLLSIDNALVLGLLAKRLPRHQRTRALSYGLIGAFVFRVIAICTVGFLLRWTFVKFLGGAYLVYIAVRHIFFESQEVHDGHLLVDDSGQPQIVDSETGRELSREQQEIEIKERVPIGISLVTDDPPDVASETSSGAVVANAKRSSPLAETQKYAGFWRTVLVIELTDIAFAVDSILAAMALAGSQESKRWLVIVGGFLGVVLMRFAAAMFIRLLERFPKFELAAYLLVIVIGIKLLSDWGLNSDWSLQDSPRIANAVGAWKDDFVQLESRRVAAAEAYDGWLASSWPLGHTARDLKIDPNLPAPIHHLLDFHDIRRPECMLFWLTMLVCFVVGFMPQREPIKRASKEDSFEALS